MRYLLVIMLVTFSGCATTRATKYDKQQNELMKLSALKYTELVKKYNELKKVVDGQKSNFHFLNVMAWRLSSFMKILDKNNDRAFNLAVQNKLSVLYLLKEMEKLNKELKRRRIIKR